MDMYVLYSSVQLYSLQLHSSSSSACVSFEKKKHGEKVELYLFIVDEKNQPSSPFPIHFGMRANLFRIGRKYVNSVFFRIFIKSKVVILGEVGEGDIR